MSRLEVLVATMRQDDFSLYDKMNIKTDALFMNQADRNDCAVQAFGANSARMYTTDTIGVSVNRNFCLMRAKGEICVLADDDIEYDDDYEQKILSEFDSNPKADVIIFNITTSTPEHGRIPPLIKKPGRMHIYSKNPYGAPRMVFRRLSVLKACVSFSPFFGGGHMFSNGEDSIWLNALIKAGLKVYLSDKHIATVEYNESTWFTKDMKKRMYARGALLEARSSATCLFYILYYTFLRNRGKLSRADTFRWLMNGRRGYKDIISYEDFCERQRRG